MRKWEIFMWIANDWKDFEVIDTSKGKIRAMGRFSPIRPDPQVLWRLPRNIRAGKCNAHYHRSSKGGGEWKILIYLNNGTSPIRD